MQREIRTVATSGGIVTRKDHKGCLGCCNTLFLDQAAGYTSVFAVYEKGAIRTTYVYFSVCTVGPLYTRMQNLWMWRTDCITSFYIRGFEHPWIWASTGGPRTNPLKILRDYSISQFNLKKRHDGALEK